MEVPSSIAEVPSSVVKMVSRVGETDGRSKNGDVMCERRICVVASTVVRERADICIRLSLKEKHGSIIEVNQQMPVLLIVGLLMVRPTLWDKIMIINAEIKGQLGFCSTFAQIK